MWRLCYEANRVKVTLRVALKRRLVSHEVSQSDAGEPSQSGLDARANVSLLLKKNVSTY